MTEAEWLDATDVSAMYVFLRDTTTLFRTRWQGYRTVPRFCFSERQSRLFAVACCRRILHLLPTDEARQCVLAAEAYADGLIDDAGLSAAVDASMRSCEEDWRRRQEAPHPSFRYSYERGVINALGRVHRQESTRASTGQAAAEAWAYAMTFESQQEYNVELLRAYEEAERARQAGFLRDIVGNPFRPPAVEPAWLAWNDRCVERMARGIYEERAYDRLPILHDALLDAGCDDEPLLDHCRTPEGHVRGCWAVDLLLGKE